MDWSATCSKCHEEVETAVNPMGKADCHCGASCGFCQDCCPIWAEMLADEEEFSTGKYKTRGEAAEARRSR